MPDDETTDIGTSSDADLVAERRRKRLSMLRPLDDDTLAVLKTSQHHSPVDYDFLVNAHEAAGISLSRYMQPEDYMPTDGCDRKRLTENCNIQRLHKELLDTIIAANAPAPISDMSDENIAALLAEYESLASDAHCHPLYKPAVDFITSISHKHFGHDSAWANRRSNPIDMVAAIRDGILGEDAHRYMDICTQSASQEYASKYIKEFETSHPDVQRLAAIGYYIAPSVFVNFSNQSAHIEWVRQKRLGLDKDLQKTLLETIPGKELIRVGRHIGGLDAETFEQIVRHAIECARPARDDSSGLSEADAAMNAWIAAQAIPITTEKLSTPFEYHPEDDTQSAGSKTSTSASPRGSTEEAVPKRRKFALTLNLAPAAKGPDSAIAHTIQGLQMRTRNLVQAPLIEVADPFSLLSEQEGSRVLLEPIVEALVLESMPSGQESSEQAASDA